MLQQILKDMYIEPELLEALNEDQKKTLFLKMRQEQVRRWKECEDKLEKEEAHRPRPKPKTGQGKSVSWLLGRDGDVQVLVIGETDELKSSKLICTGLGERNTPSQLNNTRIQAATLKSNLINKASTDSVRSGRENHPPKTPAGIQLHLKDNSEEVKTLLPPQAVASEPKPSTDSAPPPSHESQEDSESSRTAGAPASPASPASPPALYRPHLRPVSVATPSAHLGPASSQKVPDRSSASSSSGGGGGCSSSGVSISSGGVSRAPPGGPGSKTPSAQPQELQSSRGKEFQVVAASKRGLSVDEAGVSVAVASAAAAAAPSAAAAAAAAGGGAEVCVGRGRVAQLLKTFSVCGDAGPTSPTAPPPTRPGSGSSSGSGSTKPPVPTKPSHLRLQQSASLR
ncbi:hypothetical protein ACEWY4_009566 [Coilia grayii]|uniref:Uncharacterized protein n=1 Tax=Coilia grayii TaxID=363190 RepID=A0ABD1K6T8_9TELE